MRSRFLAVALSCFLAFGVAFAQKAKIEKEEKKPSDFEKGLSLFQSAVKTYKASQPLSVEEERVIGRAVAKAVFERYGKRAPDPALNRYVTLVGATVLGAAQTGGRDFKFAIIDNDEANAFAAPGGYVFITTGLLSKLKTESQLAGVLAHEVTHVTKEHMVDAIQRARQAAGVAELSAALTEKDPKELNRIAAMATDILFTKGLDKSKEFEADSVGTKYAAAAGYDAKGLYEFLERLKAQEGKAPSVFFTTHPSTGERITRLKKDVLPKLGSGEVLEKRFAENVKY